eukprot:TRINITY_DN3645_c0_g1_i1.p1 TRINITY_DN3645_c0_g1~~TRINITY_DN3645_c0_g1_i1.p1  ORF type:complete len:161 (+),score=54.93 TRINITY_DN3645_c0_g1_i1:59-541(+)
MEVLLCGEKVDATTHVILAAEDDPSAQRAAETLQEAWEELTGKRLMILPSAAWVRSTKFHAAMGGGDTKPRSPFLVGSDNGVLEIVDPSLVAGADGDITVLLEATGLPYAVIPLEGGNAYYFAGAVADAVKWFLDSVRAAVAAGSSPVDVPYLSSLEDME